jgi:hypothetical protein
MFKNSVRIFVEKIYKIGCLEGNGVPVLYIGRTVNTWGNAINRQQVRRAQPTNSTFKLFGYSMKLDGLKWLALANTIKTIRGPQNRTNFCIGRRTDICWSRFCTVKFVPIKLSICLGMLEECSLTTFRDIPTSTTAHNSHQIWVQIMPPEDGQVMSETCQDFEH